MKPHYIKLIFLTVEIMHLISKRIALNIWQ